MAGPSLLDLPHLCLEHVVFYLDYSTLTDCKGVNRVINSICVKLEDKVYDQDYRVRQYDQLKREFTTMGLKEGASQDHDMILQQSFNEGFAQGAAQARNEAYAQGVLAALGIFGTQHADFLPIPAITFSSSFSTTATTTLSSPSVTRIMLRDLNLQYNTQVLLPLPLPADCLAEEVKKHRPVRTRDRAANRNLLAKECLRAAAAILPAADADRLLVSTPTPMPTPRIPVFASEVAGRLTPQILAEFEDFC